MVTIVDFVKRTSSDGRAYFALVVTGGIEFIKSKESSNFYATSRKASIASTFDENTCKALLGQKLPGQIERVTVEPYEYTIKSTGEVIILDFKYRFNPLPASNVEENVFDSEVSLEKA